MKSTLYVFPPFRLDVATEQLWQGDTVRPVRPKLFAILRYLVEHPDRLVTREELTQAVWPDTVISDGVLRGCVRALREVLDDDPSAPRFIETVSRRGYRFIATLTPAAPLTPSQRTVLTGHSSLPPVDPQIPVPIVVVGREEEIAQLQRACVRAQQGQRQLVFIAGEPGIGKTTLVDAFVQELGQHDELWLGWGQCVEHYGPGEAYLPVLEALSTLAKSAGGERVLAGLRQQAPTWLVQLPALVTHDELTGLQRVVAGATRERMLRELVDALDALTVDHLLLLRLEDLQWADYASIDWLTALARRRTPARLLVLGTYRPTETSLTNHPLRAVKQELRAQGLCDEVWVRCLTAATVQEYLTRRYPQNQFPPTLGHVMYYQTEGNPLFLVNLVAYLERQGILAEVHGQWRLHVPLESLSGEVPDNVRQLIEKHVEQLHEEQQRLLEVASVVGVEFSGAMVAAGLDASQDLVEEQCEGLVRQGQFLHEVETARLPDGTLTGQYHFRHSLYQTVLYQRVAPLRRMRLHRRIGEYAERVYGDHAGDIAAELAVHFERGQDERRTVHYLQQSGETALQRGAYQEAIGQLTKALTLLKTLPPGPTQTQQELALQAALGPALMAAEGYASRAVQQTYARAWELCDGSGDMLQRFPVLWGVWVTGFARGELPTARDHSTELFRLATPARDPALLVEAYLACGLTGVCQGLVGEARAQLEEGSRLYRRELHSRHSLVYGQDPGVVCQSWAAWAAWLCGYPEQAIERTRAALALARTIEHPVSLAYALALAAGLHQLRREEARVQMYADELHTLAAAQGFALWTAAATVLRGWALGAQGRAEDGIAHLAQGLSAWQETGTSLLRPYGLLLLTDTYVATQQTDTGVATVSMALTVAANSGEQWCAAELQRLHGELRWQAGAVSEAEQWFQQSLTTARQQGVKAWELRTILSLGRLWAQQGKKDAARQLVAGAYQWFTEGFDTADLREAKALLDAWVKQERKRSRPLSSQH